MEKVIKDDKIAVLFSPGYGAGWYTWHHCEEALYHPEIVKLVLEDKRDQITEEFMISIIPDFEGYIGGASDLEVAWVPVDSSFKIREYDGSESIEFKQSDDWLKASRF